VISDISFRQFPAIARARCKPIMRYGKETQALQARETRDMPINVGTRPLCGTGLLEEIC